ncbi:MAG: hypothetical protein KDB79_14630 [Acidobacteria bacterium]|nr:hypothetical protein [Acidobacteriota bacterium]
MKNFRYAFLFTILLVFAGAALAQDKSGFCKSENWSNGDNVSANDLREVTIPQTSLLTVDGRQNGGISVKGENRSDILIRACVRAWGKDQQKADAAVKNTRINTSGIIKAENTSGDDKYSVSYQILVPRSTNLKLTAMNGGVSIESVQGDMNFSTVNGGVKLSEVGGNVKGMTTNGGVKVNLSGSRWNGSGLDVQTTNGGVKLSLPSNFAADIETGTVNGGLKSDFAELNPVKDKKERWRQNKKVSASINGGGPKIRVVTTNGGVKIDSN